MEAIARRESTLDNPGFCTSCGAEHYECEPDATNYKCDECGKRTVCSPEIILGVI
jgi:predicted RNA-binding Zn-ribbon protein involved in translation (DUF1610 family)